MANLTKRPSLALQALTAGWRDVHDALKQLDWHKPLKRNDIRTQWPDFPLYLYLRMPATKHYDSADAVLHFLVQAALRADGVVPEDDLPDERIVRQHGGPPAWGPDPLLAGRVQESGSATDTVGLDITVKQR